MIDSENKPRAAVPDGWKLVPVEPTEEMLRAAQSAWLADIMRRSTTIYRAMIDAAPTPPTGGAGQ